MMTTTLRFQTRLGDLGRCRVHVASGLLEQTGKLLADLPSRHAVVISDRRLKVASKRLVDSLKHAGWKVDEILVHAGEGLKDFQSFYPLYGKLIQLGVRRDSTLFALGGGTIGDAVGFLASTYLRGIPWVGVPTTLLAQVDSAVGGKTGLNHALGKNLIGSFYQPERVICDLSVLKTLGSREMVSGFGEMLKYGLVFDSQFFAFLKKNKDLILARELKPLHQAIVQCLRWKMKVVESDVWDQKGKRQALNFGHTYGHALESFTKYKVFQHGEAVLLGMRFALALSRVKGYLAEKTRLEVDAFLLTLVQPRLLKRADQLGSKEFLQFSKQDKKIKAGRLQFILLRSLGRTLNESEVTPAEIRAASQLIYGMHV